MLRGTVRAGGGRPVEDARVTLLDAAGHVVDTLTTGPDGTFRFVDPSSGGYTVIAAGYPRSLPSSGSRAAAAPNATCGSATRTDGTPDHRWTRPRRPGEDVSTGDKGRPMSKDALAGAFERLCPEGPTDLGELGEP